MQIKKILFLQTMVDKEELFVNNKHMRFIIIYLYLIYTFPILWLQL